MKRRLLPGPILPWTAATQRSKATGVWWLGIVGCSMKMYQQWRIGCVGAITTCVISLVVVCLGLSFGVQHGAIGAPAIDQHFGRVHIVSYLTWNARCPPFTGCEPTRRQSYVVWIVTERLGPDGPVHDARRLLAVPVDPVR